MPLLAEYANSDSGWIACTEEDGGRVGRGHCDAEPRFAPAWMPDGYRASALAFRGPVLYAGGNCGREYRQPSGPPMTPSWP